MEISDIIMCHVAACDAAARNADETGMPNTDTYCRELEAMGVTSAVLEEHGLGVTGGGEGGFCLCRGPGEILSEGK